MVDKLAKEIQYDYATNASLVVIKEDIGPRDNEPSGEPDTLAGKIKYKFGDKAVHEKPDIKKKAKTDEEKNNRNQKLKKQNLAISKKSNKLLTNTNLNLENLEINEQLLYRPKTKETNLIYEELLTIIHQYLPDQPHNMLKGALDDVLATLKTENMKDSDRIQEIEAIIGKTTAEEYNRILQLSKGLVDYGAELDEGEKLQNANDMEVPVEFDNEEQESSDESFSEENPSEENEEDEEGLRGKMIEVAGDNKEPFEKDENLDNENLENYEKDESGKLGKGAFDVKKNSELKEKNKNYRNAFFEKLDGFWLQREIRKYFDDSEVLKLEHDIMLLLQIQDKRECENKLVLLLNQERFDFIKILLENRFEIFYMTRLGKAQNDRERSGIIEEMLANENGIKVFKKIEDTKKRKEKEKDFTNITLKSINTQARKSKELENLPEKMTDNVFNLITKNFLDLENLKFTQGARVNSNKTCKLPAGSFRVNKKGYDEVVIPPVPQNNTENIREIPVESLPTWMHPAFQSKNKKGEVVFITEKFNKVQSKVFDTALHSDENMLICAPTSSGKTNIALLTILRVVSNHYKNNYIKLNDFKIVYIAPMKALVKETVGNFTQRLQPFGIKVRELSGDVHLTKRELEETHIIISTPEKWDIITRKTGEKTFTELVKLVIVDEVHLLHDTRGAVIESIISRTIRRIEATNEKIRIVALSATLPNYDDVATFLRVDPKKGLFYFDSSFRPIPLEQKYIGVSEKKSIKRMLLMNEITYEKVMERAGKKQMIIFVHSRRETIRTAKSVKDLALSKDELNKFINESQMNEYKNILNEEFKDIKDNELKELLPFGIAIHHAGLARKDREIVEDLFNSGYVQLIVSTATLAWGVNLPAHTVIIKGTQIYDPEKGCWTELSPQDVLQMMGRAGRFGYGSNVGEGIIITSHQELQYYLSLLNQQLPIESQLITALPDALNAEIVLGTISNIKDAVNWLAYSYLYVRMLKNPTLYGIPLEEAEKDQFLLQRRTDLVHTAASILDKHGLVKYDKKTGNFQVTQLGRVASHYYIKYASMSVYNENLKPHIGLIDLFRLFSFSAEFKQIPIREEEKQEIAKLMVKVPVPIKGSIEEPASKINILLQSYISQFKIDGYAISSDMVYISQSAGRIMRALYEICSKRGWAQLSLIILNVCKMIEKRMWSTMTPLRQFKVIPEDILYKIERKEQLTWDRFYDMTPEQIGELIRLPKQGKLIHRLVKTFPRLELEAAIQPLTRSCILVELNITAGFIWDERFHGTSEVFYIFVEDSDSEIILHQETFILKQKHAKSDYEHRVSFIVPMIEPKPPQYFIRIVSDKWLNCERLLPISFKHTILPEKFPPHTGLLDLQPLLFSALRNPELEKIYTQKLGYTQMLPIQTQIFKTVYESDESLFAGAPTGSGKTLLAELAAHRYLKSTEKQIRSPVVYVSSIKAMVKDKCEEWREKFSGLGYKIGLLTGQSLQDNRTFEGSDIVFSTPDCLDMLTRKWTKKQSILNIRLVIIDEIHLLGESGGVLETVLSRLKYIENQIEKQMRFIALGTSLANPLQLAEWLGIRPSNVFNFNPNVRPNKLEIYIQGFDQVERKMRLIAMAKPLYNAIKTHATQNQIDRRTGKVVESLKKPVMVYVSDRKQARLGALDLLTFAAMDDAPKRFLLVPDAEFEELLGDILDPTLKHILRFGVGYVHDGLTNLEKSIVLELYKKNAIQVLILTHNVCWEINLFCHLVVIVDPIKYDGLEHRWVDYSIPDMLQIMGRASLTIEKDPLRKCMLLCSTSKKEFYKKFLFDSFPLESHLNHFLHDNVNSEINNTAIKTKQDCLDWFTWTYMYRRLLQNPNYYDLQGKTKEHLNDYLSELVEKTLSDLEKANCITIQEEIRPINYGKIAFFYGVKYNTIDLFSQSLNENIKTLSDLINILCNAYEYEEIPVRNGEEDVLRALAKSCNMSSAYLKDKEIYNEPHTKANILLNCYFSRQPIPGDMLNDQTEIVEISLRIICAFVDILSTNGILKPSILSMELSQMIVQGMWIRYSTLLQLPYFDFELVEKCKKANVNDIPDLMNMEDEDRNGVLKLGAKELNEVAEVCNRYPFVEMKVNLKNKNGEVLAGENVEFEISLVRELEEGVNAITPVISQYLPTEKEELWWLVIGDTQKNILYKIRRFNFVRNFYINFSLEAPKIPGQFNYSVFLICDSWVGCDLEEQVEVKVLENPEDNE